MSLIALIAVLIGATLLAPEDASLGARMRWVYLHVSFTWAGVSLINLVGLGGVYLIFRPMSIRQSLWVAPALTSGLVLFGLGFILSLVAAQTSWGGILWMEPRVASSVAVLVFGFVIVLLVRLMVSPRLIGSTAVAASVGMQFVLALTGRVFHPENPIGSSQSNPIRLTFYALTFVALAIGLVLAIILRVRARSRVGVAES